MQWYEYVIQGLFVVLNVFLLVHFTYKTINVKIKYNAKSILLILGCSGMCIISAEYFDFVFRLLGNYLFQIFMFRLIDKETSAKSIFYFSLLMVYGIFVETLTLSFCSNLLDFNDISILGYTKQAFCIFIAYFVWFGSWSFIIKNERIYTFLKKIETLSINVVNIEFLLVIIFVAFNIIASKYYYNLENKYFLVLYILIIGLIFLLLVIMLKKKYNQQSLNLKNKVLQENVELYEKIAEDYRLMKHNLIGDLMMLKGVCGKEGQSIINEKISLYNRDYEWVTNINNIPEGLKGLFYLKMEEAKKRKIVFSIESSNINSKFKISKPKKYVELCQVLDVILNNAIEAASQCSKKVIKVKIIQDININIKIINTFSNQIDVSKLGTKDYSTKNRESGIGLYFAKSKTNKNLKINTEIINDIFISNIKISI